MKTLSDILPEKDSITNMAKGLGVINLRIFQLEGEEVSSITSSPFLKYSSTPSNDLTSSDERKRKRGLFEQLIQQAGISPEEAEEFAKNLKKPKISTPSVIQGY